MNILEILEHCLRDHLYKLQKLYPDGSKVSTIDVMEEILNSGLPGFPLGTLNREDQTKLFEFISEIHSKPPRGSPRLVAMFDSKQSYMTLLLLRGLSAHGLLHFDFQHKR
jgi:hypothetical protein